MYYRKVYNIEMNRPTGIDKHREYLNKLLNDINIIVKGWILSVIIVPVTLI